MEFPEFYRTHYSAARRWARNLGVSSGDVDDVVQEVFLVAMRRYSKFDGGSERGWLFAITRRVCGNFRRGRRRADARDEKSAVPGAPDSPDDVAMMRQAHDLMQRMLDELPEDQRLVFVLFEIEDMSANEVAEALSIEQKLVYSRLRGARERLNRMIEEHQDRGENGHAGAN